MDVVGGESTALSAASVSARTTHRHTAMMTKTTLLLLALATGTVVEATLQMVKGGGMCAGTDDSSNDYKVYYGTHAAPAAAWVRPP